LSDFDKVTTKFATKSPTMKDAQHRNSEMLRVALIASSLALAGAEKQFAYMAKALFSTPTDARVFYLGHGGYYESVLRVLGIPVCQIYAPNRPLFMLVRLLRAMHFFGPDIVLSAQFGDLLHGGIAARFCHALTLGGVRSDGFYELDCHGPFARWMARLCHGLIANSFRARTNLVSRGIAPSKIEVLPNVIDLRDFDAQAATSVPEGLPSDRIIVAGVGRLHPDKRFERLVDALALARHQEPRLFGLIIGVDQGARAALERRAHELGLLPQHLRFWGESGQVPALLARSDLLVLCSDSEGFPNILLEAMAARLPVVTTAAGDADRIVQDGMTGYVAAPEQIAPCIVRLAESAKLRAQFGAAGRERVEREYQCESLSVRLLHLFQYFATEQRRGRLLERLQATEHQLQEREASSAFERSCSLQEPTWEDLKLRAH
jgi:glycosyltransferase involved in cell wall biosynthesis